MMNGKVLLGIALAAGVVVVTCFVSTPSNKVHVLSVSKLVAHPMVEQLAHINGRSRLAFKPGFLIFWQRARRWLEILEGRGADFET